MTYALFDRLRTHILAMAGIAHCAYFNRQFERTEQHRPYGTPAVFIEFDLPDAVGHRKDVQGDLQVRLYLQQNQLDADTGQHLDLIAALVAHCAGYVDEPNQLSGLRFTSVSPDSDHSNVVVHVLSFSGYYDMVLPYPAQPSTTPPLALELNLDADIDSPVIRTGDGLPPL